MIAPAIAIVFIGLLAGIYAGDRAGGYYCRAEMDPAYLVRSQQIVHLRFVRFMPILVLGALLAAVAWLILIRSRWQTPEFWLVALSVAGVALIAGLTRAINVPLNKRLMTWSADAPPPDLTALWAPWERVNTFRALAATAVLIFEVSAVTIAS
jgi:uncharacterized membrane protein